MTPIYSFLFLIRLTTVFIFTFLCFLFLKIKKFFTIAILYLLIFVQALFVLGNHNLQTNNEKKEFEPEKQAVLEEVNLESLSSGQYEVVKANSKNLNSSLLEIDELLKKQPLHRDLLINKALVEMSLNQDSDYEISILKAKELDPNWIGFN